MRAPPGRQREGASGSHSPFLGGEVRVDLFLHLFLGLGGGMKPQKPGEWRPPALTLCHYPPWAAPSRGWSWGGSPRLPGPSHPGSLRRAAREGGTEVLGRGPEPPLAHLQSLPSLLPQAPPLNMMARHQVGDGVTAGAPASVWGVKGAPGSLTWSRLFLRNRRGCETSKAR